MRTTQDLDNRTLQRQNQEDTYNRNMNKPERIETAKPLHLYALAVSLTLGHHPSTTQQSLARPVA